MASRLATGPGRPVGLHGSGASRLSAVGWHIALFTPSRPAAYALEHSPCSTLTSSDQPDRWRQFNFDRDAQRLGSWRKSCPTADLRGFKARGGKLPMYHGWSDPALSAYSTIDYLGQVAKVVGGEANADSFVRLFLAPGMHHCSGGPGPNSFVAEAIGALEAWVEQGKAPESLIATHANEAGAIDRSRPLCAYPKVARYKGTGSIDDAANFACAKP